MAAEEKTGDLLIDTIEECFENGWTDGLPVVPPTTVGLERILRGTKRDRNEVLGILPPKGGLLTVESVAVNTLMAGCRPEYLPVVLAAAEAIADPLFYLQGNALSTRGPAPLVVVNGPIRNKIEINCRSNVFGPGWRANATIGRALRLLIRNIGGALAGELDRATLGHPGKYTYCIGEDEEHSPWEPLHVQRGFAREASAVTVIACDGPHPFGLPQGTAQMILDVLVDALRSVTRFSSYRGSGDVTIVFDQEQRRILAEAGYSKADVSRYVFENTWRTAGEIRASGSHFVSDATIPNDRRINLFSSESTIYIIAGGVGNRFGAFMPTWRSEPGFCEPVSRLVDA